MKKTDTKKTTSVSEANQTAGKEMLGCLMDHYWAKQVRRLSGMTGRTISDVILGCIRQGVPPQIEAEYKSYLAEKAQADLTEAETETEPPETVEPPKRVEVKAVEPPKRVAAPHHMVERHTPPQAVEPVGGEPLGGTAAPVQKRPRAPRRDKGQPRPMRDEKATHMVVRVMTGRPPMTAQQAWEACREEEPTISRPTVIQAIYGNKDFFEKVDEKRYRVRDIVLGGVKPPLTVQMMRDDGLPMRIAALLSLQKQLKVREIEHFLAAYGMEATREEVQQALRGNPHIFREGGKHEGWSLV